MWIVVYTASHTGHVTESHPFKSRDEAVAYARKFIRGRYLVMKVAK